jgi:uncharacterized cupredoxin-like copper-binding protein
VSPAPSQVSTPVPLPAAPVEVVSHDIFFEPKEITIPANTDVTLILPNQGVTLHNFTIDALGIDVDIAAGQSEEVVINAAPGEYTFYCNVPGHKEAGMVGTLVVSETVAQQAAEPDDPLVAAQATIAAQSTEVAALQAQQANAQVTATALAVVAANSVLDPNRSTITIQTDLAGMLAGNEDALRSARDALTKQLEPYPDNCRAGFVLISGNAPTIEQGIDLARQVDALLREDWPGIFTESTGLEVFALPNEPPAGQATIDIFFYSGCLPPG